ncbi:hypothetical protein HETIRDRAFT_62039 [Heterobasidion irregulare TC 32-1]|uniref:Uncharacterized protein n=1 Tax=Heterobasidion irregulare (strain TC 32-1) TaxID=747525 RepID=W4K7E4_HETIT|nr:uncharacterized protein HETIRDRAFT_62039 [Heterobasidion irregulare TC 32-1]ETW80981.1 hypothetical protein HETIRDRAFT_62039 [Heterobasidion irregulare TC 32-1]
MTNTYNNVAPLTAIESPPTYEHATGSSNTDGGVVYTAPKPNTPLPQSAVDVKLPLPVGLPGPHPPMAYEAVLGAGPSMGPTSVYHYIHPITGDRVISLLPPNDPKMVCLQEGVHVRETRYGILGVLAAVFWFPLGIGLCLLDRKITCKRCGAVIEDGLCS